jgi:anti-sigma B factor antagonist
MILSLASRIVSDVVVIEVSGKLRFSECVLSENINSLLKEGYRRFIINLAGITHIDAFGVGQLITVWTLVGKQRGDIWFSQPSSRVLRLLNITKLDTIFQIINDEAEILDSELSVA